MAFVDEEVKFVLTNYGKEKGFERGFLNLFKYFSISDDGVRYTSDVEPKKLRDISGTHSTSTNVVGPNKNHIIK